MTGPTAPNAGLALSEAEREREYSPSSAIGGDYQPFITAYRRRSAAARAEAASLGGQWLPCRYGSGTAQRLQLCRPPARAGGPPALLVFVHGGYWQELSARDSLFPAAQCVARGLAFAALDYTLAPHASVAGIVAECRQAMAWLFEHAPELAVDPQRIVIAGSSAGAHLAAMMALPSVGAADADGPRPHATVLLSGIYELEPLIGTSINTALQLDAARARALSPALHPLAGFAPSIVGWGEVETAAFKAQSRAFAAALQAAGTRCIVLEVAGRNHFDIVFDLVDDRTALGRATLALIQER